MSQQNKRTAIRTMDEAEPKAGWSATPIAFVVLLALLVYWGMVYLSDHSGGFHAQVYAPFKNLEEVNIAQPETPGGGLRALGKLKYSQVCVACHQANGLGSTTQGAPPLDGSEWVVGGGPNRIIRIVLNGLAGPIEVKGQQWGAGVMTPFKESFTDEEIAGILTYIRSEWSNKADPVDPETVKKIRAEMASKNDNWNPAELLKVPDK